MHPRCPPSLPEPCPHVQAGAMPCSRDCSTVSHMAPLCPLRCCDRDASKCSRIRDDGLLPAERRRVVREFNGQGDTEAVSKNKQRFTNSRRKKMEAPRQAIAGRGRECAGGFVQLGVFGDWFVCWFYPDNFFLYYIIFKLVESGVNR